MIPLDVDFGYRINSVFVMNSYTVKDGDCLESIARAFKLSGWKAIYDHPKNADFKAKRPNPNILCPGDTLYIPAKEVKTLSGASEQCHRFRLKVSLSTLRLRLLDDHGERLAYKSYRLIVDGRTIEGSTDGNGLLEASITSDAAQGILELTPNSDYPDIQLKWKLVIGGLDPVDEITGVQARLRNLGYPAGSVDGILGPMTRQAVRLFQNDRELEPTGEPDQQTRKALEEQHDVA